MFLPILNKQNEIVAQVCADDLLPAQRAVKIAGAFTSDGDAVNTRGYKVSRNKKIIDKLSQEMFPILTRKEGVFKW